MPVSSKPVLALVFGLLAIAPALAADYGNASDVAAIRKFVERPIQINPGSGGASCTVHAIKIVVADSFALVSEFFRDPCGGGGESLFAKRNGTWVEAAVGRPMIRICEDMKAKGVPQDVIVQLETHFSSASAARIQQELKGCQH